MKGICKLKDNIDELNFSTEPNNFPICYVKGKKYKFNFTSSICYVSINNSNEYFIGFSHEQFNQLFQIEN